MKFRDIERKVHGFKNRFRFRKIEREGNRLEIDKNLMNNISLRVTGKNNYIRLTHLKVNKGTFLNIRVCGNNNVVDIDGAHFSEGIEIIMGQKHPNFGDGITGAAFRIQSGTGIEHLRYITFNSHAFCTIGKNCMFSYDITLFNTDAHPIISRESGKVINWVDGITIGNHCWIGQGATIMKNSSVPDDCIIGYNAVVSGKLPEPHSIYAGNPAKFIKSGITWDPNGASKGFIENSGRRGYHK